MKALRTYSKEETHLLQLLRKLNDYGELNCDFPTFSKLYEEWHQKTFPGCEINTMTAIFRDDWFLDFVNFLANKDI